jgi:hypothetical protein
LGVALVALAALLAATPAHAEPLRSIAEIRAVPILEANQDREVVVRGVVTLLEDFAVIQDGDQGIYVVGELQPPAAAPATPPRPLGPGMLVEVEGTIRAGGYSPMIVSRKMRVLEESTLPAPAAADMGLLFSGLDNGLRVALRGVVQEVNERQATKGEWWLLVVETESRHLLVQASKRLFPERPDHLVDADVEIVGIVGDIRNSRGEFIAPGITIGRAEDLVVVAGPVADPFAIASVPLAAIARYGVRPQAAHRMRTQGVVSFASPGRLFLQEGFGGVRVDLAADADPAAAAATTFQPGDRVEVAGFLDMSRQIGGITGAVARKIGSAAPPEPLAIQPREVVKVNDEFRQSGWTVSPSNYDGCLVRCRALVESTTTTPDGIAVALTDGGIRRRSRGSGQQRRRHGDRAARSRGQAERRPPARSPERQPDRVARSRSARHRRRACRPLVDAAAAGGRGRSSGRACRGGGDLERGAPPRGGAAGRAGHARGGGPPRLGHRI